MTGRFEWFAIDYTTRFWIEKPGKYSFMLLSDDGSAMYIDERRVIDNDCMHPPLSVSKSVRLEGGIHDMRVGYFKDLVIKWRWCCTSKRPEKSGGSLTPTTSNRRRTPQTGIFRILRTSTRRRTRAKLRGTRENC